MEGKDLEKEYEKLQKNYSKLEKEILATRGVIEFLKGKLMTQERMSQSLARKVAAHEVQIRSLINSFKK